MFGLTPYERRNTMFPSHSFDAFDALDDFEKHFFGNVANGFRTDIKETENEYELTADLPGVKKEDIKLTVDSGYLTISAEKNAETNESDDKGNFIRRERSFGSIERSFDVSNVDESGITAAFENGVLTLHLPKRKEAKPQSHEIAIA